MAQTYQMKHNQQGTIYSLLTVESNGQMTVTFHGTDREISHEVTENADGWLCYPGAMFPGLASGKWQSATQMRNENSTLVALTSVKELEMRNENEEMSNRQSRFDLGQRNEVAESETTIQGTVPAMGSEAESERTTEGLSPMCAEPAVQALRGQAPCNPPSATHTGDSPREPRPRRQRKPRVERRSSASSQAPDHQPIPADAPTRSLSDIDRQPSATLKAVGMVAAATVALFVIYETGLLIPLGLIGLATGGILK